MCEWSHPSTYLEQRVINAMAVDTGTDAEEQPFPVSPNKIREIDPT